MSGLTELPKDASALANALTESGDGEWRELLDVAERMGYRTPEADGILPRMTQRLMSTSHPCISFTLDDSGQRVSSAILLP